MLVYFTQWLCSPQRNHWAENHSADLGVQCAWGRLDGFAKAASSEAAELGRGTGHPKIYTDGRWEAPGFSQVTGAGAHTAYLVPCIFNC